MYIDIDNFSIFTLGQGVGFFTDASQLVTSLVPKWIIIPKLKLSEYSLRFFWICVPKNEKTASMLIFFMSDIKTLEVLFNFILRIINHFNSLSQQGPYLRVERARSTDVSFIYLRFSKRYVDENTTIRFSIKIYTNS
jgi:hypothetical protein